MPLESIWPIVIFAAAAAVLLAAILALWSWRRRRRPTGEKPQLEFIDVGSLPSHGPPAGTRQVTCYGVPVRLAAIVVAPSGRGSEVAEEIALRDILDAAVPGLANAAREHSPRVDRWPTQLSAQGFVQAFYARFRLPEDHGKGTPWCSVAGRVEHQGRQFVLGLVCCADRPNSLGEITVEHAGRWLDVLRMRD